MSKMIVNIDEDGLNTLTINEINRLSDALNTRNRSMKNESICHAIGVFESIKRLIIIEEDITED
jgi:hypothetical protein